MLIAHVLRLTKWEWFKLRRRWMPWILLAIAVLLSQVGIWANYAAYHNDTVQELSPMSSEEVAPLLVSALRKTDRPRSVDISCKDVANDRIPAEFDQLTEEQRESFLKDIKEWSESGACDSFQAATSSAMDSHSPTASPEQSGGSRLLGLS